ncbi:acetyl-CoA carboxylase biotin carboxylase subunit [candidate division LCP-89 bacterium B3_LCP]|uniref:Acetyl-CoA carboxylase biotin carboxylase subunit n=1 Tax=candidate division LCP-89 bacterium B3_LCP TaxID=2012998 RepID=A0A532UVW1_UNCL8|nr:MAG: acetyl-CoA carboxylase biotin carboxylase subunit [candidate division LCP-89 bacterium B3_LCP]
MFNRILIANRGEIAVRIIRAAREMGIETVAVYSDADRMALHTRLADYAYNIGPPPSAESYLNKERIIEAARQAKAEAIHPGYGFLAENADFAGAVTNAGLTFIGPPPQAIRDMGLKTRAREIMQKAGVPVTPGTESAIEPGKGAEKIAQEIGYPVLIKAASGGGGKGMRIVHKPEELLKSMEAASREAASAFGDPQVYIEKYLESPRHIEIQVLADHHGNVIHLNERECSIQRRHQKVIEEAPSPVITPELREKIGAAAVAAARACGYQNAGTVEFLFDKRRNFYFMEMNTRLQVEHPVTEMTTGIDLVKEQLKIAAGEPLTIKQEDVKISGHAIECRIYAEDPLNNFFPSTGRIDYFHTPAGPGIRNDSGIFEGGEISVYYDPLISKLVAWGGDRAEAIQRMKGALQEYHIAGVHSNIAFCLLVMNTPAFVDGKIDTHFIEQHVQLSDMAEGSEELRKIAAIAAVTAFHSEPKAAKISKGGIPSAISPWLTSGRRNGREHI